MGNVGLTVYLAAAMTAVTPERELAGYVTMMWVILHEDGHEFSGANCGTDETCADTYAASKWRAANRN